MLNRCTWCGDYPEYIAYHDREWGVPLYDDQKLFEFLILEGMQAGLSWLTILRKREGYREAFFDFNPDKIVTFNGKKVDVLMQNPNIIRNRKKIESIVNNAFVYLELKKTQSFSEYLWSFVDGKSIQNKWGNLDEVPGSTHQSELMSKHLKSLGFKFVGSTICYAFMQATGMVNDHVTSCFRYEEVKE